MSTATQPDTPAAPPPAWSVRVFSLPAVMGVGLMALLVWLSNPGAGPNRCVADVDIWWHLRHAAELLRTGHFPHADTWTFTVAGRPWMNFEWLAEIPYYFGWKGLGDLGLYLVTMLTVGAIIFGIYLLGRMRSGSWKTSFVASVAAVFLATISLAPRTLLFGWLFLVIELAVLWGLEKGRDYTAWLPALFALWINTHGSWFIGFVLMVLFFACGWFPFEWGDLYAVAWTPGQKRKWLAVTAASAAALFLNPYGWRLVIYPLDVAFRQKGTINFVAEWASLDFNSGHGKTMLAVLLVLALAQLLRPRRWSLQDLMFALIGVYGACTYLRFLFLAAILLAPMVAMSLKDASDRQGRHASGEQWVNAAALVAMLVFIGLRIPSQAQLQAGVDAAFPARALPFVRTLAGKGNLFNDFGWGGYLELNAPQVKELNDTMDVFAHLGVLRDYLNAIHLRNTFAVLDKYRIRYVLLGRDEPMVQLLQHSTGWKTIFDDGREVVIERTL